MTVYSDTYSSRSAPTDEAGRGEWRIMRNGRVWARRQTLGAARAAVSNAIAYAGAGDTWAILDIGDTDAGIR